MWLLRLFPYVLAFLFGIVLALVAAAANVNARYEERAMAELANTVTAVKDRIGHESGRLQRQLNGFSRAVSADRDFSMKLFVEHDRSAPEVSEISQRYMEAMDLSFLEVADSALTILSCGQFSAATGKRISAGAALLDTQAVFLFDDLRGEQVFSFQARVRFTIAETPLYAIGGLTVDQDFLQRLVPSSRVTLILKQGSVTVGTREVESISPLRDHGMIVNDVAYLADSLRLPFTGDGNAPVLYVLVPKVPPKRLISFRSSP